MSFFVSSGRLSGALPQSPQSANRGDCNFIDRLALACMLDRGKRETMCMPSKTEAHPRGRVSLNTLVDLDTDERRRRLQARTGLPASRLVAAALRALETQLEAARTNEAAARSTPSGTC
jgi:hypothetical protein